MNEKIFLFSNAQRLTSRTDSTGGGDGGGDSMLEVRVAKLESDVEFIKRDVAELKTDVREIKQSVSTLHTEIALQRAQLTAQQEQLATLQCSVVTKTVLAAAISSAANKQILWTIATIFAAVGLARFLF